MYNLMVMYNLIVELYTFPERPLINMAQQNTAPADHKLPASSGADLAAEICFVEFAEATETHIFTAWSTQYARTRVVCPPSLSCIGSLFSCFHFGIS
jgi:hypothetical protein